LILKEVLKKFCTPAPYGDLANERTVVDLRVRRAYEYDPRKPKWMNKWLKLHEKNVR
jgi:hypothetical protein